jgi:hypothetical protein
MLPVSFRSACDMGRAWKPHLHLTPGFREAPVIEDTARSEPGDHLLRGGGVKALREQLRVQLGPREIAPGEQRDGRRTHGLGGPRAARRSRVWSIGAQSSFEV